MTPRVTDQSRYMGLAPQYNSLLAQQLEIQQQISSGQRLTRPDQDPAAASQAQGLKIQNNRIQQDLKNISSIQLFSEATSGALDSAVQYIQRAHELAVSAGDSTKSPSDLASIASEVNQVIQGLVDVGSQTLDGQNLFSGSTSGTPAFTASTDASGNVTSVSYNGDGATQKAEYAPGKLIQYNVLGSNENGGSFGAFKDVNAGVDTFQTLIQLRNDLTSDPSNLSTDVQALTGVLSHLTIAEVQAGSTQSRLTAAASAQQDLSNQLVTSESSLADTDVAAAATHLSALQTSYQAALAMGATVEKLSLVNYLGTTSA